MPHCGDWQVGQGHRCASPRNAERPHPRANGCLCRQWSRWGGLAVAARPGHSLSPHPKHIAFYGHGSHKGNPVMEHNARAHPWAPAGRCACRAWSTEGVLSKSLGDVWQRSWSWARRRHLLRLVALGRCSAVAQPCSRFEYARPRAYPLADGMLPCGLCCTIVHVLGRLGLDMRAQFRLGIHRSRATSALWSYGYGKRCPIAR